MSESKTILGIMSGTSLDGLDFALCRFKSSSLAYDYEIIKTGFYPYDLQTKKKLSEAQKLNAYEFILFHKQYGKYIGQKAKCFLKNEVTPDIIASHGHTVFHKPQEQITFQIGDAAFITAETGIPVISDFRNLDTALKGQGAPLVPAGDKLLFPEYDICLNLGGFANISYDDDSGKRKAFDVSPFNFIINNLVKPLNKEYDKDGEIGKTGKINISLLSELDNIPYYKEQMPKSLGREYVESYFFPVLDSYNIPFKDKIRTFYEHAAYKI
ncbi:MAG: anhydro-N-acetylmuramic acid kinase, partial [Chlorobi bacterium]|nr:anhydro-N-acetylmuramic acid kinase [Chlorobiota bacterium]